MITDEYPVDVGFGNIYQLYETLDNVGFGSLTARGLLAVAYAAGEHGQMLPSGPKGFLATWESKAEARSIRPPGGGSRGGDERLQHCNGHDRELCGASRGEGCQSNARDNAFE